MEVSMSWFGNDTGSPQDCPADGGKLARQAASALAGLLAQRGMTRSDLAKHMGVSPGRVSQILSGDSNLTMKSLASAAKSLGVNVEVTFSQPAAMPAMESEAEACRLRSLLAS
jgi:transcriptional regulator with XRE-family HTH domain